MSNLPISSKYRSTPNEPVTDTERDTLSAQLNDAFTAGKLEQDEYDSLLETIFGAKTLGDLVPAVEALGKPATYNSPAIVQDSPKGQPGELTEARKPPVPATMMAVGGITIGLILVVLLLIVLL